MKGVSIRPLKPSKEKVSKFSLVLSKGAKEDAEQESKKKNDGLKKDLYSFFAVWLNIIEAKMHLSKTKKRTMQ